MPQFNLADAIYLGSTAADKVYIGSVKVWPPGYDLPLTAPEDIDGLFYYIGTNRLTTSWTNPITSGEVGVQHMPGVFYDASFAMHYAVDRGASGFATYTAQKPPDQWGWITYDFGSLAMRIDTYTIMGRQFTNSNFMRSWILEGSNDNTNWDALDVRVNDTQQNLYTWGTYSSASSQAYRYVRVRSTALDSSGNAFLGYGEIELYGVVLPFVESTPTNVATLTYSSNGDSNGVIYYIGSDRPSKLWSNPMSSRRITAHTTSQYGDTNYYPWRSVDRGTGNAPWHSGGDANARITYDFGAYRVLPTDYTMMGRSDYNGLFPRNWVLEGSNDRVSWDILDTRTNDTQQNLGTWGYYTASASVEYRFLSIRSTGNDSSGAPWLVIGEIEFYGDIYYPDPPELSSTPTTLTFSSTGDTNGLVYWLGTSGNTHAFHNPTALGTITASGTSQYSNYAPEFAFNRTVTSPWISQPETTPIFYFDFGPRRIDPNYYTIRGRSDSNDNHLRNWVLEGTNDGVTWDTLDTRVNDTQQGLGTWGQYSCTSSQAYASLRLKMNGVNSSGGGYLIVDEIEFYGDLYE